MKTLLFLFLLLCSFFALASFSAAQSPGSDPYKIGINDVISIKVLGHEDLSVMATVAADGTLSFPHVGSIYVKDKSVDEIKDDLTQKLSDGYVKYPTVSVAILKTLSKRILVHGEVASRGAIPYEKDMNITMALSLAGGVRDTGLYGKLKIRRKIKEAYGYENIIEVNLDNGFIRSKKIDDTLLEPDDILVVEKSETFLIEGEVAKRGRFIYEKDITVLRALSQAGGINERGLYGMIKIRREDPNNKGNYKFIVESGLNDGDIEDKEIENILLKPDDILVITRSETFLMEGAVAKRGRFVLEKNMTVLKALLEVGGISENGLYGTVTLRRKPEGSSGDYKDFVKSKLNNGMIEDIRVQDTFIHPDDIISISRSETFLVKGEIARRGRFVLEKDMTVLRALLEAGGVTENGLYGTVKVRRKEEGSVGEYKDYVETKINNGVLEDSTVEDTLLEPDDILEVGRNKTYFIYGEVNKTGEYVLQNDMTVFKAITIAGGFTKWGSESKIKILRHDGSDGLIIIKVDIGKVLKADASADILLQPGDTIVGTAGLF